MIIQSIYSVQHHNRRIRPENRKNHRTQDKNQQVINQSKCASGPKLKTMLFYYTMAREKYVSLGNDEMAASIDVKIEALQTKLDDYEGKMQQAENYMAQGEALKEQSDYYGAKQQYLMARAIYSAYAETKKADQVQELIEQMDNYIAEKNSRKQESK